MDLEVAGPGNVGAVLMKRPRDEDNLTPIESKRRKPNRIIHDGGSSRTGYTVDDYSVGWVCALYIELAAAKCMLDHIHDCVQTSPDDTNTYIFGSIGEHNVAIACLPLDGYGTNNAVAVANNMRRTFTSIGIFLMVGIGGGVPGKADIRLGDVVVSTKVIQYDLGKTIRPGHFQSTAFPRRPSETLMKAVSSLRAHHELESSRISIFLSQSRERYPPMVQYTQCEQLQDLLFNSTYDHTESAESCNTCDKSKLVDRPPRSFNGPMIHYGTIASGNQVIKHADTRDKLAREFDAVCFEMEAAGMMDNVQPLVIRGICDYSDSHKNKQWQKYASATAAAYAKELLLAIPTTTNRVHLTDEMVSNSRQRLMDALSFEKIDARHENIKPAYNRTCAWLLDHPDYIGWLNPAEYLQHHGFLWIRGKPGAGKSTLMKYIYAHAKQHSGITISFFFNARGDVLEKSTEGMYRSLLFQLLKQLPDLQQVLDRAHHLYRSQDDHFAWKIHELQNLLSAALRRLGPRSITCFVDALDECDEPQVRDMIEFFEQLGQSAFEAEGTDESFISAFSSRHYPTICIKNGRTLTVEDQLGHGQDMEKYIRSKLRAGKGKGVDQIRTELLQKAAGVFMWVVLVVDILNKEFERGRIFAVKKRLQEIPAELSELFKDILKRDKHHMADLLLCIQWILYAKRPLKPEEFYYAIVAGLEGDHENLTAWDPEYITRDDMDRFVSSSSKGLAEVTRTKARTVQFIHESVRDFLLKDGGIRDLWPNMEADFQSHGHNQLKECCYTYITTTTDMSQHNPPDQQLPKASSEEAKALRQQISEKFPFLEYATRQVLYHADAAAIGLPQHDFLKNFDLITWVNLDNLIERYEVRRHNLSVSLLYILAENGLARLITSVLDYGSDVHIHGERHEYPLFAALAKGYRDAVRALLQLEKEACGENSIISQLKCGRDFEPRKGQIPLSWAAENGFIKVVQLLLNKGADFESKDKSYNRTPLIYAAENGHIEIVQLLLDKGADLESKDSSDRTPLFWAAESGHIEVVQLLLDKGASFESKDKSYCQTPLFWAAESGHIEVVQLLLDKSANFESKNYSGRTPLSRAAERGHTEIVQLLLDKGADFKLINNDGHTPLSLATRRGHTEIARLLTSWRQG